MSSPFFEKGKKLYINPFNSFLIDTMCKHIQEYLNKQINVRKTCYHFPISKYIYFLKVVTERKLILNCYSTPIDRYLSLRVLDFSEFKQILNSYFFFQIRNVILKIRHVFIKFTLKELDKGDLLSFLHIMIFLLYDCM